MNDEFNNDNLENENSDDLTALQKMKNWVQENLRIIISVLVVLLIASSIYSYSKRGEQKVADTNKQNNKGVEDVLKNLSEQDNEKDEADITDESASDNKKVSDEDTQKEDSDVTTKDKEEESNENKEVAKKEEAPQKVAPENSSQETENSFIETAVKGDSLTKLARKALAHYLEKNPDSALTPEHKIYIEDYLRKNANFQGRVYVGTSVEFSKSLIKNAIESSKKLNDAQLQNLHKYAVNVQF